MIVEDQLRKIFGANCIHNKEAMLDEYSRDMSFVNPVRPECIVKPRNTDDIVKIVKHANETLNPLVPVSSGSPHFRGDSVPSAGGAIIVDLSDMKKIMRIDRPSRMAMCEPGTTFGELVPAVAKGGMRLNTPLLPRSSKSVVGSLLEREPVIMPKYHWDISDPLACVEVIFGTGDLFRTGSAAGPGTLEEQWVAGASQKEASGPTQASWHRVIQGSQGTMGIVTWASMRCELLPTIEKPFLAGSAQLDKIIDLVQWLIRLRLVNECLVLNRTNLAAIMAKKWPSDYQYIKDTLPPWVVFFNIAGYDYLPQERIDYQTNDIVGIAQRIGVEPVEAVGKVSANELLKLIQRPSAEPYWKLRNKGGCQDVFFFLQ